MPSSDEDGAACRKSSPKAIFSAKTGFPCTYGAAGKTCKETLLRKASEADAHVVSFGTRVGGLRPSDTSQWVYRQSVPSSDEDGVFLYAAYSGLSKRPGEKVF